MSWKTALTKEDALLLINYIDLVVKQEVRNALLTLAEDIKLSADAPPVPNQYQSDEIMRKMKERFGVSLRSFNFS